jgi:hypothetical protein
VAARATDAIELTSFGSPVDLLRLPENTEQRDIERLVVVAATAGASIVCRTAKSGDTDRPYTVAQGDKLELCIRQIRSVTNVTRVRVEWGDF